MPWTHLSDAAVCATHHNQAIVDADPESQSVTTENTQDAVYNFDTQANSKQQKKHHIQTCNIAYVFHQLQIEAKDIVFSGICMLLIEIYNNKKIRLVVAIFFSLLISYVMFDFYFVKFISLILFHTTPFVVRLNLCIFDSKLFGI